MRVDWSHGSDVPDCERPVVGGCIEVVVLLIELTSRDRVSMAEERLDLFLVVQVPNSDYSVFASTDHVLSIVRDSKAAYFIEMAFSGPVEFLALTESHLGLALQVPKENLAVFRARHYPLVVWQPLHTSDGFFVAFHEGHFEVVHVLEILIGDLVEELFLLMEHLEFEGFLHLVVVFLQDVDVLDDLIWLQV